MELDIGWIEEFEKDEELYKDFYKDRIETVPIVVLYIDKKNHLFYIKKDRVIVQNNTLEKKQLVQLMREYMLHNEKKYRPISILKWNINMEPEEVPVYLKDTSKFDFLTVEKKIDNITFDDTINLFHNVNGLYIVFHESWKSFNNKTKKIYIKGKKLKLRKTKSKRT